MSKNSLENFNHFDLLWPSKYLKAGDLKGREVTVVIDDIEPRHELVGQGNKRDNKPVFWLRAPNGRKIEKAFICNKTNGKRVMKVHGPEITAWVGKTITLYAEENAKSDSGWSIAVRGEKPRQAQATNGTQQARSEQQRRQEVNTGPALDSSSDDFADIGDPPMSEEQQTEFGDAMANDDRRAAGT